MSKGHGQKIAIRFTKPLLGSVSGNTSAFTVSGFERDPLLIGELTQKQYPVIAVERYPLQTLFEDDFDGVFDDTELGANGVTLEKDEISGDEVEDTVDDTTLSGSSYSIAANRIEIKAPGRIVKVKAKTVTAGSYTLNIKDDAGTVTHQTHTITGASANGWITFVIEPLNVNIGDKYRMEFVRPSGKAYMKSGLYNGTLWKMTKGIFGTSEFDYTNPMGITYQDVTEEYQSPGIYNRTLPTASLPTDPRLRFEANEPDGTSITAEYSADGETWTDADDGDLLTISGQTLHLRFTLETEDEGVSPTLLAVWLEEASAPPDTILLTIDPLGRFNNVEGELTVSYERDKGTLTGVKPVEDFEESFTPEDLIPTPVGFTPHEITGAIGLEADFIAVTHVPLHHAPIITGAIDLEVKLIPVSEIPP